MPDKHQEDTQMKTKNLWWTAPILVLALASLGYAQYVKGYKVSAVAAEQVEIVTPQGDTLVVPDRSGKYTKGDKVEYDAQKNKIRPTLEGC